MLIHGKHVFWMNQSRSHGTSSSLLNRIACSFLLIIGLAAEVSAWNDFGHMTAGAIAYDRLTPRVRTKVEALLRLNPSYREWVAGIPEQEKGKVAFIKRAHGRT